MSEGVVMLQTKHQSPGSVIDNAGMRRQTILFLSAPESNSDGGSAAKRF